MRAVPPIPKELLIHTVEYHEYIPDSPYGDAWKDPVILTNVRLEPNRSMQNGFYEEIASIIGLVLFYCFTHSQPSNITFPDKSKVIFNGRELHVNSKDELYAFGPDPHHLEVVLK